MTLNKKPFESIMRKGENADNQHFLLLPQCFLPYQRKITSFEDYLNCHLQMLLIWTSIHFLSLKFVLVYTWLFATSEAWTERKFPCKKCCTLNLGE